MTMSLRRDSSQKAWPHFDTLVQPLWSRLIGQNIRVSVEWTEHIMAYKLPRALRTHIRSRTGEDIVPGHALFPWMLPHAAWSNNPFQPQSRKGGTHGSQNGHILQESSAFIHGGVHDQSTHQYSWTEEETGCTVAETNLGWEAR